jgi:hypothetical protein
MALEAAYRLNTPLVEVGDLFLTTSSCDECCIPAQWTSPLTCEWLERKSLLHAELQMLQLAGLVHRWLATFIDGVATF